jgi:hypothetical protein
MSGHATGKGRAMIQLTAQLKWRSEGSAEPENNTVFESSASWINGSTRRYRRNSWMRHHLTRKYYW